MRARSAARPPLRRRRRAAPRGGRRPDGAAAQIEEASRLLEGISDPVLARSLLVQRGAIRAERNDLAGADQDFRRALQLVARLPPTRERGGALNNLAMLRLMAGDPAEA